MSIRSFGSDVTKSVSEPRGHGDGAFVLDLGADPARRRDHQVGRDQLQAPLVRLHLDVRGLGQSAPGGNRATDHRQAARKIVLQGGNLHSDYLLTQLNNMGRGTVVV